MGWCAFRKLVLGIDNFLRHFFVDRPCRLAISVKLWPFLSFTVRRSTTFQFEKPWKETWKATYEVIGFHIITCKTLPNCKKSGNAVRCNTYRQMHRADTIFIPMGWVMGTWEATDFEHSGGGRTWSKAHKGNLACLTLERGFFSITWRTICSCLGKGVPFFQ